LNGDISLCFGFNEGDRAFVGLIEAFSSVWSNYFWPTGRFTKTWQLVDHFRL